MKKLIFLFLAVIIISCDEDNPVNPTDYTKAVWEVQVIDEVNGSDNMVLYFNDDKSLTDSQRNFGDPLGKGIAPVIVNYDFGGFIQGGGMFSGLGGLVSAKSGEMEVKQFYDAQGYPIKMERYNFLNKDSNITIFKHNGGKIISTEITSRGETETYTYKYNNGLIVGLQEVPELVLEYDANRYLTRIREGENWEGFNYKDNYRTIELVDSYVQEPRRVVYTDGNKIIKEDNGSFEIIYTYENGKLMKIEELNKSTQKKKLEVSFIYKKIG